MFKAEEIYALFGIEKKSPLVIKSVTTDSREAGEGSLFIALKGEKFDGNKFIASALEKGCPLAIGEYVPDGADKEKVIVVPSGRDALLKVAGAYRRKFSIPLVGITGSVGKTTTREFVSLVMKKKFKLLKNEENLNNEIGVSHCLLKLDDSYTACCMEMGMDGLGQIEEISTACYPQIAVITNIGVCHLEKLGSRENILKAKTEILKPMDEGSDLIICRDNDLLENYENPEYKITGYGINNEKADIRALNIVSENGKTAFDVVSPFGNFKAEIPCIGEHNVLNALASFAVGHILGIEISDMVEALKEYEPVGLRQREIIKDNIKYVADCYNASPDSLMAASKALSSLKSEGRKLLVFSDMLELGGDEEKIHEDCGKNIASMDIDFILTTGRLGKILARGAGKKAVYFEDKESLSKFILENRTSGDVYWFKASRGMKLEDVIDRLI